ncbi:CCL5 protein, partial [Gymnorhina tibicen]|nr:CCL5 protein [Gymnorhina tibicen]
MKTFTAALAVLFVAVFCCQATSSPPSVNFYGPCCYKYMTSPLPLSRVVKYERTGNHCSLPGVIFTTIKDKMVCANLNDKWVQDIMNQLKDSEHSG